MDFSLRTLPPFTVAGLRVQSLRILFEIDNLDFKNLFVWRSEGRVIARGILENFGEFVFLCRFDSGQFN